MVRPEIIGPKIVVGASYTVSFFLAALLYCAHEDLSVRQDILVVTLSCTSATQKTMHCMAKTMNRRPLL